MWHEAGELLLRGRHREAQAYKLWMPDWSCGPSSCRPVTYPPASCCRLSPQAWQQRHSALLPLLVVSPPAALLAGPAATDPAAAVAAGMPPLLLVSGPTGSGSTPADTGAGSIVHAALGVPPSHAPLSASLLLQAAAVDEQGQRLLRERAAAAAQLAGALRQYAAASACLLGGVDYAGSSQHAHWLAAFQAAMDLPIPEVRPWPGWPRASASAPAATCTCSPCAAVAPRFSAGQMSSWRPLWSQEEQLLDLSPLPVAGL